jgi:hypothetical protein
MVARSGTYVSSNNVIVTGAEDIMGVPVYGPLFGAYIYTYKYGKLETVKINTSTTSSPASQESKTVEGTVGEKKESNDSLKKLWDFLKKLV